ncbi:MAG: hypothetical protein H0T42_03770 [Deltaproteobacteria bacterium]|nr:hypothetical protein [Deltaproteobacteria bacterium]
MARLLCGMVAIFVSVACASPGTDEPDGPDAPPDPDGGDVTQVPPQGRTAVGAWLADGHYLAWACEPQPHAARPPGAHGTNRVCSNAALSASVAGTYPLGAASVKEIYSGGSISGYAVSRKVTAGTGAASWYWYEAFGTSVVADGIAAGGCAGCHAGAPRDNVFTHVQ